METGFRREESPPGSRPRARVLYIEDDQVSVKAVENVLSRRPGLELVAVSKGDEGLALARGDRPLLIILDLGLPDRPGIDVLEELRSDRATREIPVMVLTADTTPEQQARLLVAGAFAYLTKPFSPELLLALVDEILKDYWRRST
jgi:DNA-binding response OmpR family regulator